MFAQLSYPGRLKSLTTCLILLALPAICFAQPKKEEKEIPPVEDITIRTSDGVVLHCSWYAGTKEKKTVPVLLLHGWNENRQVYKDFALELQTKYGHAVLVPDLRGHGESTELIDGTEIDLKKFGKKETATVLKDIEQCRKFLQEKNNEGKLNLEMLTCVAAGDTCLIAATWAIEDWKWDQILGQKQGKFVKALVFLTPSKAFEGVSFSQLARAPIMSGDGAPPIPIVLAVGSSNDRLVREVKSVESIFERARPTVKPEGNTEAEKKADELKKRTVFYGQYPGEAEGTAMLNSSPQLRGFIAAFIQLKVVDANLDWQQLPDPKK
jgi:hypothetical protein